VIKYEKLNKLNFIKELFNLESNDLEELQKIYSKTFIRKGYTNFYSYKTNLFLDKLEKHIRFMKYLNREKVINQLEKFFPKKKLKLDFDKINIDIDKLDKKYAEIISL
jgi:uncharacterized GH25 family protein